MLLRDTNEAMTADELRSDGRYVLLGEMTHATLADFVIEYFLRRTSWVTRVHHLMSLATFVAIVAVAIQQQRSFARCTGDFVLSLGVLAVVILPLHEALHAVAYALVGARDIRWGYSLKLLAVWVIAHRFVARTGPFVFVALAPFVVLNALLLAGSALFPSHAVFLLFVLLVHLHGCAGDWSLLNFIWIHRERGFLTFDDAEEGKSWFYGRAGGPAAIAATSLDVP